MKGPMFIKLKYTYAPVYSLFCYTAIDVFLWDLEFKEINKRIRNFALCKNLLPIHQSPYNQVALDTRVIAELIVL
jgi:hypothetical protein